MSRVDRLVMVSVVVGGIWMAAFGLALLSVLWALGRIGLMSASDSQPLITEEGPELHTPMPELAGRSTRGSQVSSGDYSGRELVIVLLSPTCGPCEELLLDMRRSGTREDARRGLLMVMEAEETEAKRAGRRYRIRGDIVADASAAMRLSLGVDRTPYCFLVDSAGIVRMKGVVNSASQLQSLIERRGQFIGSDIWLDTSPAGVE